MDLEERSFGAGRGDNLVVETFEVEQYAVGEIMESSSQETPHLWAEAHPDGLARRRSCAQALRTVHATGKRTLDDAACSAERHPLGCRLFLGCGPRRRIVAFHRCR